MFQVLSLNLVETEKEFWRLCSLKRFAGEILTYVPLVGEVAAEHFDYHIPSPEELYDNFAHTHHFTQQHAEIDAAYESGAKIDKVERICGNDGCFISSPKSHDHFMLSNVQWR